METTRAPILSSENSVILASELERFVSADKLAANAANYPEMQSELSPDDFRKVELIKLRLLKLPLIHATKAPIPDDADLLPSALLPQNHPKTTFGTDKSLGLDNYAFFNWGLPEKSEYGKHFLLVDPKILFASHTIVTPEDLGSIYFVDSTRFDDLPNDRKQTIQKRYFDKVVSGKAWLEIIARRFLNDYKQGSQLSSLSSRHALGEIKHLGPVSATSIQRKISADDLSNY